MTGVLKMFAVILTAAVPGGLVLLAAFIVGRTVAAGVRASEHGPNRYRRALAGLTFRAVWDETLRSL